MKLRSCRRLDEIGQQASVQEWRRRCEERVTAIMSLWICVRDLHIERRDRLFALLRNRATRLFPAARASHSAFLGRRIGRTRALDVYLLGNKHVHMMVDRVTFAITRVTHKIAMERAMAHEGTSRYVVHLKTDCRGVKTCIEQALGSVLQHWLRENFGSEFAISARRFVISWNLWFW